jgi:hypothetical protein
MEEAVRDIQSLKAVRRGCVPELVQQLLLVAVDAREAYLLDLFSTDREQLQRIVSCFVARFCEPIQLLILEIPTGDFLIVKPQTILSKLHSSLDDIHIVNVNAPPWHLLNSAQKAAIQSFIDLDETFTKLREYCALPSASLGPVLHFSLDMEPNPAIGFEFLAGWLLGYPVVYNCPLIPAPAAMGALAMQELRKVSLFATLRPGPAAGKRDSAVKAERVSAQEFTLPGALCPSLRGHLDERIAQVTSRRDWRGRWSIEWTVVEEVVTSPAVTC